MGFLNRRAKTMKKQRKKEQTNPSNATREDGLKTITQTNAHTAEDRIRQRAHEIHQTRGGAPAMISASDPKR